MNGLTGQRRRARPVRLALAQQLGADIDGAWWPRCAATSLSDLIEILHRPLSEIVDICINWSVTEAAVDLSSIVTGAGWRQGDQHRRHRLMVVAGGQGCANPFVVPHISPHALTITGMRYAAGRRLPASQRDTEMVETAASVVTRGSRGESSWAARRVHDLDAVKSTVGQGISSKSLPKIPLEPSADPPPPEPRHLEPLSSREVVEV